LHCLHFSGYQIPLFNGRQETGVDREGKMKHFTTAEWIDLVNQVVSPGRRLAMEKHVENGCKLCARELSQWQRVRHLAAAEASYQPPQEAVRIAKAAFAGSIWARERKPASSLIELLFDSFLQPALQGVRSGTSTIRRLLYRADPFEVDLQIEPQSSGKSIVVTGQLLDLRQHGGVAPDVPVVLSNLSGRVVQTVTNQFGEFREVIENSGDLELMLHGGSENPVVVISLRDALGQLRERAP
jgi:hypothetical protein